MWTETDLDYLVFNLQKYVCVENKGNVPVPLNLCFHMDSSGDVVVSD